MRFFVIVMCLFTNMAYAVTDVDYAKEARKLLWQLPEVGRGSEEVCKEEKKIKWTRKGRVPVMKNVCKTIHYDNVALAIKQPSLHFKIIYGRMDTCASKDEKYDLTCVRNNLGATNGLNTHFVVNHPFGYKVYAIRRIGPGQKEWVYSPYSDELNTPIVRHEGKKYLDMVVEAAYEDLRRKGVKSLAFPKELAADVVPKKIIHALALIEHIDHMRFESESLEQLVNEVYTTIALNREGAYNLAPSKASAHGLFQYTERTYRDIRMTYPDAHLMKDFLPGAKDHINVAKAAILLIDHDLSLLRPIERKTLRESNDLLVGFSASTYNGGPSCPLNIFRKGLCAIQLYRKFGEFVKHNPNPENSIYVRKMFAVLALRA